MTVEQMIADILRREGGFVDHPADRGGPTNFGITQATLTTYWGRAITVDDVRQLTKDQAREIYFVEYYREPHIERLPERVQPIVFDCAINNGPAQAIRLLQQTLNQCGQWIAVDGKIGPLTIAATAACERERGAWLVLALLGRREALYRSIAHKNLTQQVFLRGWLNRIAEFVPAAEDLRT